MTPLQVLSSDPGGSDRLAAQVVARPDQKPPPPIEPWPFLLQPKALHLRLMPLCDAACDFCETVAVKDGSKAKEEPFSPEMWEHIKANWLPDLEGIEVAGLGEPTLSKMWGTVARDVLAAGKVFYAPTNGHYLDQPFVYEPLGTGKDVRLSVSLDAGTPETYVKVGRGKNEKQWFDTLAAIKTCMEKCPEAQWHSQFTATAQNIDDLPKWMETLAGLGIKDSIMRFAMMLTVPREENSLRFLRDKTEAAIYEAQLIAEKNGISFEVERRPYSEVQPNGLNPMSTPDTDSPVNKLRRYLDLAPMSVYVCGGATTTIADGKTCTTIFGSTSYDTTSATSNTYVGFGGFDITIVCGSSTCVRHYGINGPYTLVNGTLTQINPYTDTSDPCPGFGTMNAGGEPEIVRSVIVPRGTTMEAMSVPSFQPVRPVDASPIVWSDGSISSCFAKHMIGDIYQDTLPTLIRNPWYQAFLQRRIEGAAGGVMAQESCLHCPRNF